MESVLAMLTQASERTANATSKAPHALLPSEWRRLVSGWNATHAPYPRQKCLHELFEASVLARPDAVALIDGARRLTFAELNQRANQLAHFALQRGIGCGDRVALAMPRSLELVVAQIAVVKCGAAYVPLDESAPPDRHAFQVADSACKLVLTTQDLPPPQGNGPALVQMRELRFDDRIAENVRRAVSSEVPAYVMYTSGSTGEPKGVEVPHRAVTRLLVNNGYAQFDDRSRVAFIANPAFDPSTLEVWAALLHGGTIVVMDRVTVRDPVRLRDALLEHRVTVLNLTSGMFNQYADTLESALTHLDYLLVGGDVADPRVVQRVLSRTPPRHFVYTYGPTETTLFATACELNQVDPDRALTIGHPISNTSAHVLDVEGRPTACDTTGELYIGGPGVALGYLKRPELSAERFVPDPFSGELGARLYRTGDLARWNSHGELEFVGRSDLQIKVRGFRIEPGEIEAKLRAHPAVREAVVVASPSHGDEKRLIAYYVPIDEAQLELSSEVLRNHLSAILPEYMVPAAYVHMSGLPLTANGKMDRQALPPPGDESHVRREHEAPYGELEQIMARLWAELLDVERVGRRDNFFELGGDSILAIKLVAKIRAKGLELQPSQVAEHPTLDKLAACLGQVTAQAGEQGTLEGELPLTPVQRKFFAESPHDPHRHNQSHVFELSSHWELNAMCSVFRVLELQHDMLRVRYRRNASDWTQEYGPPSEQLPLEEMDARAIDDAAVPEWLEATATDVQAQLNIYQGPLYQVRLVQLRSRSVLLVVIHHLVVDGVSWRIITDDLNQLLTQLRRGDALDLGPKTWSFRQWGQGLLHYADSAGIFAELCEYWRPSARTNAVAIPDEWNKTSYGVVPDSLVSVLSKDETARLLTETPRVLKTLINDVLLTALGLALRTTFGPACWRIQLEGHGREQELVSGSDLGRTVGWFTADFPFVIDTTAGLLPAVLSKVKSDLRASPHKGVGYGVLLQHRKDLSDTDRALLQGLQGRISFNYLGQMGRDLHQDEVQASPLPNGTSLVACNESALVLDIMAHVSHAGCLEVHFQSLGNLGPTLGQLATAFHDKLIEVNAYARQQAAGAEVAAPSTTGAPDMLARAARPADYETVKAICEATFASPSRWVAKQLAARTWLDPLWNSADSGKFVLEIDGQVVGYLLGSCDIDQSDFRGLRTTTFLSPGILAKAVLARAAGKITSEEARELAHTLKLYGTYTWWRARHWLRTRRGVVVQPPNVNFHFNILLGKGGSGGAFRLIGMWEQWLRTRRQPYAFLHIESFHGLIGNRALQQEMATGLGYERNPEIHPVYWIKKL